MPSPSFESEKSTRELSFEFDEDGNLQRPRPAQRPSVQLVIGVHLHDVRTYGRDPQKPEVFDEAILIEPAAKLPRKVPCNQYDVEGRWTCGGAHFVLHGSLSESLLLLEGGSVYRVIFRDNEHCIEEPVWHNGVGVDVARAVGNGNKPVHIPLVAPHQSPYAAVAEEFVSPVTIRLDKNSSSTLHLSFDWRRLYHGAASQPLAAFRFSASRPSLYCVRVSCSDNAPSKDYGVPQFGLRCADQTEAVVFDTELSTSNDEPHRWRSCLPRSGESLRIASNICAMISSRWPGLYKSLPVVVALVNANKSSDGLHSEPFTLAGRELWSPCFDTIERVSSAAFDSGVVQGTVRAYWEEDVTEHGMSVLCALRESSMQELLPRIPDVEKATRDKYLLPVDDAILSQLLQSNTRCCVINVHMLKKGDSVPGVDDPPVWHPSDLNSNGAKCPSDTFRCSGSFTSVSMAANGIRAVLAM